MTTKNEFAFVTQDHETYEPYVAIMAWNTKTVQGVFGEVYRVGAETMSSVYWDTEEDAQKFADKFNGEEGYKARMMRLKNVAEDRAEHLNKVLAEKIKMEKEYWKKGA